MTKTTLKTKIVRIGDLKIDPDLTALRHINKAFVSRYRQNLRAGAIFPLIIIQAGTMRVVSGNHRTTAILEEFGEDHQQEVVEKSFADELEVLKFFTEENIKHGVPVDGFTRTKLIIALLNAGATDLITASIFNISVNRINSICDGSVVQVQIGDNEDIEEKPVKRGFKPGRKLTEKEYDTHLKKDHGMTLHQHCNEIIRWLDDGLVQRTKININVLQKMRKSIDDFLKVK